MRYGIIYSFNSELYKVTGIQKVLMDIHHAISCTYEAKIVGTKPFNLIHKDIGISKDEYIRLKNPFIFYNSIVIVHERKFLLLFWILNHIFFQKIKIIYVHHNILYGWKFLPIFPKYVVAISESGIENLVKYFNIPRKNIYKIYNCVKDIHPNPHKCPSNDHINIIYPARINDVKRQLEIVDHLNGKLDERINIYFVGEGPLLDALKEKLKDNNQFKALGFRDDVLKLLQKMDYMMLFSKQEGLPITLIEADMTGTPIICNNVGGNTEIVRRGENGFVLDKDDWSGLINTLNSLMNISEDEYNRMSINSRKIYEKLFTFERFQQSYLKLIQIIINTNYTN